MYRNLFSKEDFRLRDWYLEIQSCSSDSNSNLKTDVAKRTVHPEWREINVPKDLKNEHVFELTLFRSEDDDASRVRKRKRLNLRKLKSEGKYKCVKRVGYKLVRFDDGEDDPVVFGFQSPEDAMSCVRKMNNENDRTKFCVETIRFEIAEKQRVDLRDLVPLTQHDIRTNTLRDDLSSLPDMPLHSVLFELNDEVTTLTPSTRLYVVFGLIHPSNTTNNNN